MSYVKSNIPHKLVLRICHGEERISFRPNKFVFQVFLDHLRLVSYSNSVQKSQPETCFRKTGFQKRKFYKICCFSSCKFTLKKSSIEWILKRILQYKTFLRYIIISKNQENDQKFYDFIRTSFLTENVTMSWRDRGLRVNLYVHENAHRFVSPPSIESADLRSRLYIKGHAHTLFIQMIHLGSGNFLTRVRFKL